MNTVTLTMIFYTTLKVHFGICHQESNAENEFDDFNDKINYHDSDQKSAMENKNIEGNDKSDDQELEAFQDQIAGSNEKLNNFHWDSTNDENRDMMEPKTLVKKETESNDNQDESNTKNRDVKVDDAIKEDDNDDVDKERALDDEVFPAEENDAENREMEEEMEKEREAGDAADLFGTNQHYTIPVNYPDFSRRFVLTYPYIEKNVLSDSAETHLENTVKEYLQSKKQSKKEITPMRAPPEFVLEIAKQSSLLEASKPKNPADEIVQKDILRTGDFWDDVWKEDVDADKILRTNNGKRNGLESIRVNILPGSKLYQLISMLKQKSPRFLYVINKSNKI